MDSDPCADKALWSVLNATVPDLTLAGVLAGFLIAVVAALVVNWYDRASPRMIALFASGVPALTLSSYLFTISSGAKAPPQRKNVAELIGQPVGAPKFLVVTTPDNSPADPKVVTYCNQVWSEWLPAFAALLIGGSVLLCGLGWALVIYGDHLAERLKEKNLQRDAIEDYHKYFIGLNALLSLGATIGMTGLLIAANVTYLTSTAGENTALTFFEFPHGVKWYAMYFVFLFGVYVVVAAAYLVLSRSTSFPWGGDAPRVHTKYSARGRASDNKRLRHVAKEIGTVLLIALVALLAGYLTRGVLDGKFSGDAISYVKVVTATYAIIRLAYLGALQVQRYRRSKHARPATTKGYAEAEAEIPVASSDEAPEDAIQLNYSSGRLRATTYHVVFFALLGAVFTAMVTNGYLWKMLGSWQIGLTLFIGGLYPACILLGLSYSVPADTSVQLAKWRTLPVLRYLP
jgi:hypothetical protein